MAGRRRSVATCSSCRNPLQGISEQPENGDDLYCMSLSLMPDIIKIGRSKNPTQRAIELQTSMPFWVFPSIVWLKKGETEGKVHERLRPFRVENAPSREYFKMNLKQGSDLVEQVLYAAQTSEQPLCDQQMPQPVNVAADGANPCSRRRKLVMCVRCQRIQATLNDVQTHSAAEHLFLVCSSQCPGLIGVMRSSEPHQHVQSLESGLPWRLEILTIWYGKGDRREDVYEEFANFRVDCPGGNWFHMSPQPASAVISKLLFGNADGEIEPGIALSMEDEEEVSPS